ncbi:unnamed protein product [Oikopleura dioica]|uniref:Uncharacterized protein n=1 Tax=Oikopleura dioica TaxID=34765 RepID=E4Y029_OIKDI|nr:unnamed protein product [Oikopleura dioica]
MLQKVSVCVLPLLGTSLSITLVSLIFPICRTMFYGVISMIIVDKYPNDMGFMFGIANVTAGFVLFFLTNYIASNTDFLNQIMLVLGIFCAASIVYPVYELREISRKENKCRKQEAKQQN